jgi:hypothetical protein
MSKLEKTKQVASHCFAALGFQKPGPGGESLCSTELAEEEFQVTQQLSGGKDYWA